MSANKLFYKHLREKEVPRVLPILGEPYEDTGIIAPNTAVAGGNGISDGDKGDIIVSSLGQIWIIENGAVTGNKLNQMGAVTGQVLKWNGSTWIPSTDENTTYSAGQGLELEGTLFKLAQNGATTGQVLKWNGTEWLPANDETNIGDITSVIAGTGLTGGGTTGDVTLNLGNTSVVPSTYGNSSSVPTLTVDAQGRLTFVSNTTIQLPVSQLTNSGATTGQILKWNGSTWIPSNESVAGVQLYHYNAGNGGYVFATGLGITFIKIGGYGLFTMPEGVKLISARVHGTTSDLVNNTFSISFSGHFLNQDASDLYPPTVIKYDRMLNVMPTEAVPYTYDMDNTPQMQITGVNPLKIRVINLNGIVNWGLKIQM